MGKPVIVGNTITIPSHTDHLADVDLFLEGLLRGYGIEESILADIAISVSELVNNAILHGNGEAPDKNVIVSIDHFDHRIRVSVRDQGHGFVPDEIANPLDEANLLKEVGRGIFIVRSLMDKVDIVPTPAGTTITIEKAV